MRAIALLAAMSLFGLLAGCTHFFNIPISSDRSGLSAPDITLPAVTSSEEPSPTPTPTPTPGPKPKFTCKNVSKSVLSYLEEISGTGVDEIFPTGKMVQLDEEWWAVAVRVDLSPWSVLPQKEMRTFITNAPSDVALEYGSTGVESDGEGPVNTTVFWGKEGIAKAKNCLGKRPAVKMKCSNPNKVELAKVGEYIAVYYGGRVTKVKKVKVTHFSVIAAQIEGAIDGVEGANDRHPKDTTVTWLRREFGDRTDFTEIVNGWSTTDEKKYGPKARQLALNCIG